MRRGRAKAGFFLLLRACIAWMVATLRAMLDGPRSREVVALLVVEDRVFTQLHAFGKALASSVGTCGVPLYTLT